MLNLMEGSAKVFNSSILKIKPSFTTSLTLTNMYLETNCFLNLQNNFYLWCVITFSLQNNFFNVLRKDVIIVQMMYRWRCIARVSSAPQVTGTYKNTAKGAQTMSALTIEESPGEEQEEGDTEEKVKEQEK